MNAHCRIGNIKPRDRRLAVIEYPLGDYNVVKLLWDGILCARRVYRCDGPGALGRSSKWKSFV